MEKPEIDQQLHRLLEMATAFKEEAKSLEDNADRSPSKKQRVSLLSMARQRLDKAEELVNIAREMRAAAKS